MGKKILLFLYFIVWIFVVLIFWFFTDAADAMGYSLVYLWGVLPISIFLCSMWIGKKNDWGRRKWIVPIGLGITYMLAEYATFQIYNSLYFGKINLPRFEMIVAGGVVSILGLAVGSIFCRYKRKAGGDK